jgi:chromosome segregation ATPase
MSGISASELQQRLSEQLQALSQVGEILTLRLLELEERLEGLEDHVLELDSRDEAPSADQAETGALLAATEERLARLEELLSGRSRVEPLPLRRPLPEQQKGSPAEEPDGGLNPFPEDEEQPFMDELSA